uniref:Uncharacterized protein n=1 Tax=Oncorhynchus kisutch TaxID=8019 RepID=A0A8C7LKE0_ONCKI
MALNLPTPVSTSYCTVYTCSFIAVDFTFSEKKKQHKRLVTQGCSFTMTYCVKIFNIRPYRYMGPISQGEALGYLLPLQERFSGITSHMELQMCDRSDPSPYI